MYRGFFINLDSNTRRLTAFTEHLKHIGLADAYQRFPAVDGRAAAHVHATSLNHGGFDGPDKLAAGKLTAGELGIWLTHENLLRANAASDSHLHVLEDDAVLARGAAIALPSLLNHADEKMPGWDIIFTEILMPLDFGLFSEVLKLWQSFKATGRITLFGLKGLFPAHMSSFFVNKNSIDKYLGLISGLWSLGLPIDLHVRALINLGRLNAFTCVPFLSSVSEEGEHSDIRGRLDDSRKAFSGYSRALFIDADHARINLELQRLTENANLPTLSEIYLRALAFTLTDKYKKF